MGRGSSINSCANSTVVGLQAMDLTFPNRSRSYDEVGQHICFFGYDGSFEIPFHVQVEALTPQEQPVRSEADCLAAFDAARNTIQDVAREAYSYGRKTIFVLTPADFL